MKLYIKFLLLLVTLFFIFSISYSFIVATQNTNMNFLHEKYKEDLKLSTQKIIKFSENKFESFIFDNSYWDEMVEFTKTSNKEWAKINLEEPSMTYHMDYICVVNNKSELIYKFYSQDNDISSLIDLSSLDFTKPLFSSYTLFHGEKLFKIYIAPIQQSDDIKRIGKPQGYLIIGKYWSNDFIDNLDNITLQKLEITKEKSLDSDISLELFDNKKNVIGYLEVYLDKSFFQMLEHSINSLGLFILVMILLSLGGIIFFLYNVVLKPINLLRDSLSTSNSQSLHTLLQTKDEFGLIANLIVNFFQQQQNLLLQLQRADEAEKQQKSLQNELFLHNQNLENTIYQRTQELEKLNKSLDKRVEEEIKIRQIQDKMIAEQSKYVAMGEMIGNIAHQWRQPLSVISTIASSIQVKEEFGIYKSEQLTFDMDGILEQTKYLSNTIDDFRNFLNPDDNKKEIAITFLIEKAVSITYPSLKNNHISLIHSMDTNYIIEGNENELLQVLINVINNAKDAILEHKSEKLQHYIFIEVNEDNKILEISIQDTGGGIQENIITRVFEPYFTTKHKSIGTGIGLSMSYKIITERHNGTIEAYNNHFEFEGNHYIGACFKIKLQRMNKSF